MPTIKSKIKIPHKVYETPEDIKRINDELGKKAEQGLLIGLRQSKEELLFAEPRINGVWIISLDAKGYITKIVLF